MLEALPTRRSLDRSRAHDRILAALARIYDTDTGLVPPGGAAALWILLLAFLAAPALLLQWSGSEHSFVINALLYAVTLVLGGFVLLVAVFGYFTVTIGANEERAEVIWAWVELEEPDRHATWAQSRHHGRLIIAVIASIAVMVAGLRALQGAQSWLVELGCLVLLAPLIAAALAGVSALVRIQVQPLTSRRPTSPVPGDVTMVNLLNLAFFCLRKADGWDETPTRQRILKECERVAAMAGLELLGPGRLAVRCDPETTSWAREQSASFAATLRQLKRRLLMANERQHYDAFIDAVSDTLAAAVEGDWDALTSADAPPQTPKRLRRAMKAVVPSALLVGAAFALPQIFGSAIDDAAQHSIRASLLVAAFLVSSWRESSIRTCASANEENSSASGSYDGRTCVGAPARWRG